MIDEPRIWWPWAIRDEETGMVIGVRNDAPDEIKREYDAFLKRHRNGLED